MALPFFLARIFHESRSVEDITKIAQQLRESNEATRFREHLRYLRQAEGEEDIETLHREIQRYETLLRQEYGESEKSLEVIWSVGASAAKAAALQTPAATADAAVTTAKGLASVPAALSRWWYGRKVALIARTIRQGRRARGLQAETERLFGTNLNSSDLEFLDHLDEVLKTKDADNRS